MEPAATSFLVARDPPSPKTAHLGQIPAQPGWARHLFLQTLCFLLANGFAWGLYRGGDDLGFAVSTTYLLMALCCCLWKLLRRDGGGDPSSVTLERRRFGLIACAVSLALVTTVAVHVAWLVLSLPLKVALWMLGGLAMGLALYFMFVALFGGACAKDAGRCPEKDFQELSPEKRV